MTAWFRTSRPSPSRIPKNSCALFLSRTSRALEVIRLVSQGLPLESFEGVVRVAESLGVGVDSSDSLVIEDLAEARLGSKGSRGCIR